MGTKSQEGRQRGGQINKANRLIGKQTETDKLGRQRDRNRTPDRQTGMHTTQADRQH
jgi:hypothetical protein